MSDIVIEFLEKEFNKSNLFYFKQNENVENIIDCFYKEDNRHFAVFYRATIEEYIDDIKE